MGADLLSRDGPLVKEWHLHPWVVAHRTKSRIVHCFLLSGTHEHLWVRMLPLTHAHDPSCFPPVDLITPTAERVRQEGLTLDSCRSPLAQEAVVPEDSASPVRRPLVSPPEGPALSGTGDDRERKQLSVCVSSLEGCDSLGSDIALSWTTLDRK